MQNTHLPLPAVMPLPESLVSAAAMASPVYPFTGTAHSSQFPEHVAESVS